MKAEDIIHKYRMLLMDEGEDFGEEILVTELSHKIALIDINHSIEVAKELTTWKKWIDNLEEVRKEIIKLREES